MQKGAMDYFSDLERGMKEKGIIYDANMWDFEIPVYTEAATEITEDLGGRRVVRITAMDGRKIQPMNGLPVKGVILTIRSYGVDRYKDVEPFLEVDLAARKARLDTADLHSSGEDEYAARLAGAMREITSGIGFSMER